jgi:hypothetical protein
MFASPEVQNKLTPELSTQLTKTYMEEDLQLRRLSSFKNCITLDDYINVAHRNSLERMRVYREKYGQKVSEFQLTGQAPHEQDNTMKDNYVIIELTEPKRFVRLALSDLTPEAYQAIE